MKIAKDSNLFTSVTEFVFPGITQVISLLDVENQKTETVRERRPPTTYGLVNYDRRTSFRRCRYLLRSCFIVNKSY